MKVNNTIKQPRADKVFNFFNWVFLSLALIVAIYPLYFIVIASISDVNAVNGGDVWLIPKGITFIGYERMLAKRDLWMGYRNTIFYAITHTCVNLSFILTAAYALSRKDLKGRNIFMGYLVVTMYFGGGLIPNYFLAKNLGLINNVLVMIIPGAVSVSNIIVARTYFNSTIPDELLDAAKIDGCNDFKFFISIVLPLSSAIIAVMSLYAIVGKWNSYFDGLMYLQDREMYPLQLILRELLIQGQLLQEMMEQGGETAQKTFENLETMKYGLIIVSTAPVLMAYPFLQKYFVKGVMIGAIKG